MNIGINGLTMTDIGDFEPEVAVLESMAGKVSTQGWNFMTVPRKKSYREKGRDEARAYAFSQALRQNREMV